MSEGKKKLQEIAKEWSEYEKGFHDNLTATIDINTKTLKSLEPVFALDRDFERQFRDILSSEINLAEKRLALSKYFVKRLS